VTQGAPVICVQSVAQAFDGRMVYRDVSFDVLAREIFVILGRSGCGKSTLMKQMIGLLPPTEGSIDVLGRDISKGGTAALRGAGVMFQSGALLGSMTLLENVMLPLEMHTDLPHPAREAVARAKLGLVELEDAAGRLPAEISGGMVKRAGIARALALDPALLFLDEPSAGLDPVTSAEIDQLILSLRDLLGATFVVITHELPSIMAIADRCLMLDPEARTQIALGDPRRLRDESEDPRVRAFFRREAA